MCLFFNDNILKTLIEVSISNFNLLSQMENKKVWFKWLYLNFKCQVNNIPYVLT